jgi:hypothetical protein
MTICGGIFRDWTKKQVHLASLFGATIYLVTLKFIVKQPGLGFRVLEFIFILEILKLRLYGRKRLGSDLIRAFG